MGRDRAETIIPTTAPAFLFGQRGSRQASTTVAAPRRGGDRPELHPAWSDAPGRLSISLRVSLGVVGLEWGEIAQRESESGDPVEQPLEMRLIDDRPGDVVSPSWAGTVIPSNAEA
jgi:hypothetical protein